jgi:hypothetical protein
MRKVYCITQEVQYGGAIVGCETVLNRGANKSDLGTERKYL